MRHTLINEQGHKYEVDLDISQEDEGILVIGIPGWHCPIMFETDTGSNGELELVEARSVKHEDGRSNPEDMGEFRDMGLEDAIAKYLKED